MAIRRSVPESVTADELIDVVMLREPSQRMSRVQALHALRASDSRKKAEIFQALIVDREAPSRIRHLAVMGLYEQGTEEAVHLLVESARDVRTPRTLAPIAMALGRIGGEEALPVIQQIGARTNNDLVKAQADFAASVLAYRLNVDEHTVRIPSARHLMKLDSDTRTRPIQVASAERREISQCMAALATEPVGIGYSSSQAHWIECEPNTFMLLWNEAFVPEGLSKPLRRKAILGVLARKSEFWEAYSLSAFLFATPSADQEERLQLSIHRTKGQLAYMGEMRVGREGARFEIRTVQRPGAAAVHVAGGIREGTVRMEEAVSAVDVQKRKVPQKRFSSRG